MPQTTRRARRNVYVASLAALVLGSTAQAGFILRIEQVNPSAAVGPVEANVFIRWDGNGVNTLSSINVVLSSPSASLTLANGNIDPAQLGFGDLLLPNPRNFQIGYTNNGALAFTNALIGNVSPLQAAENLLTTITFLPTTTGVFPISLELREALRGGIFTGGLVDITNDFTVLPGTISVNVPAPATLSLLGFAGLVLRRRRAM